MRNVKQSEIPTDQKMFWNEYGYPSGDVFVFRGFDSGSKESMWGLVEEHPDADEIEVFFLIHLGEE